MPRILHLIDSLEPSSAQNQMLAAAEKLAERGCESSICVIGKPPLVDETPASIKPNCRFLSARARSDVSAWRELGDVLRGSRPSVIHAWTLPAARWTLGHRLRAPLVLSAAARPSQATGLGLVDRIALRRAAAVLVRSRIAGEQFGPQLRAKCVHIVPLGVAPPARPMARADLVERWQLPADAVLVGAAGKLNLASRLKDLVWAADMLKMVRDDVHLLIFGNGPLRDRFERFTRQVRIEDKVHFVGVHPRLADWLAGLDMFWSGRDDVEPPLSLLQAMAAGLPVIATDVPGSREVIEPGINGVMVPAGGRAALARATQTLLGDADSRQRLAAAARSRVLADYTVESMSEALERVYEAVLAAPSI